MFACSERKISIRYGFQNKRQSRVLRAIFNLTYKVNIFKKVIDVIRRIDTADFQTAVEVIRKSFTTVAKELGLTEQNFSHFTGFSMSVEKLQAHLDWGWLMFGLHEDNRLVGYVSLSKEDDNIFELHNLAVLPEYRHKGYGKQLLDFCKSQVKNLCGNKIVLGMIKENTVLNNWYAKNGFISTGTKKFDTQPTTVEFMEYVL